MGEMNHSPRAGAGDPLPGEMLRHSCGPCVLGWCVGRARGCPQLRQELRGRVLYLTHKRQNDLVVIGQISPGLFPAPQLVPPVPQTEHPPEASSVPSQTSPELRHPW